MTDRRPPKRPRQDPLTEMRDRVRRIETRLTQFMIAQGVLPSVDAPKFTPAPQGKQVSSIAVASLATPLKEILDNIPATCEGPVAVLINSEQVAMVKK